MYEQRWKKIKDELATKERDAFVARLPDNIRYLSCTEISSPLANEVIIPREKPPIALVSSLERDRAREHCRVADQRIFCEHPGIPSEEKNDRKLVKKVLEELGTEKVLVDERIKGVRGKHSDLVERMRMKKDREELQRIRKAVDIAKYGEKLLEDIAVEGKSEQEVANELDFALRHQGSQFTPFRTIIASGVNSAFPHWQCTKRRLCDKDVVICDFGAWYKGYCSDLSRTIFVGNVSEKVLEVYELVKEAQKESIKKIKSGMRLSAIDISVREVFKARGYVRNFVHSTGHGIGLEVHEKPRIASAERGRFEKGMVVTVEPGIYIPGKFGVRIEDDVLVSEGVEILSV